MASVYYLFDDSYNVDEDIFHKYAAQHKSEKQKYSAAVKIQKVWRGTRVRNMIKHWNKSATIIQKNFRRYLVKIHLPEILLEYYKHMVVKFYDEKATKIQTLWRGYKVRKVKCMKQIFEERRKIKKMSIIMAHILRDEFEVQKPNHPKQDKKNINNVLSGIFDRHHLLRTKQIEGVLSKHGTHELSAIEKMLSAMPWTDYMKKLRKTYNENAKIKCPVPYMFPNSKLLQKQEDLYRLRNMDYVPKEVPLGLDKNIHEKMFKGVVRNPKTPYKRMVTRAEPFKPAIRNVTRSQDKSKNVSEKDFNLNILKNVAADNEIPEYYLDFWVSKCCLHNYPSDSY